MMYISLADTFACQRDNNNYKVSDLLLELLCKKRKFMEWIVLILLIIGVALFLKKSKSTLRGHPYEQQGLLFTAAERSFYGVLCQATKGKAIVFGKVRVGDILKTRKGLNASERQKAFNKISAKHFDFVLCKPDDLSVLAAVELDDSSHNTNKRILRDEFLEGACKSAGLKLHRFKARKSYTIAEVQESLFPPSFDGFTSPLQERKIEPALLDLEQQLKKEARSSAIK